MSYTKTTWVNGGPPAISAANLQNIDDHIATLDRYGFTLATVADLANTAGEEGASVTVRDPLTGGDFNWSSTGTHDGIFVFTASGGGFWNRVWDQVNARVVWGGGKPQLTAFATFDNTPFINAFIKALPWPGPLHGRRIVFDPGWWTCYGTIEAFHDGQLLQAQRVGPLIFCGSSGNAFGETSTPASRIILRGGENLWRFIDARSSQTSFENIAVMYNAPARTMRGVRLVALSRTIDCADGAFTQDDVGKRISGHRIPLAAKIGTVVSGTQVLLEIPRWTDSIRRTNNTYSTTSKTITGDAFSAADIGAYVTGPGMPSNQTIASVESATQATLRYNPTSSQTGVVVYLHRGTLKEGCTITNGSNLVQGTGFTVDMLGCSVIGRGIPADTFITATTSTEITLNQPATASHTSEGIEISRWHVVPLETRGRTLTDAVLTSGGTTMTSASGGFQGTSTSVYGTLQDGRDHGARVIGAAIPGLADGQDVEDRVYIEKVVNSTTVELSRAATSAATGAPDNTVVVGEIAAVVGGFQGSLIDYTPYLSANGAFGGDSSGGKIDNCLISPYYVHDQGGPTAARSTSADCLVNWGNTIHMKITGGTRLMGARFGVRCGGGVSGDTPGVGRTYYANGVEITAVCEFAYLWGAAIVNPAQGMLISTPIVEGMRSETMFNTPGDTGMDRFLWADGEFSMPPASGIVVQSGWFGDCGGSTHPESWISNGNQTWEGFQVAGCHFGDTNGEHAMRFTSNLRGAMIGPNRYSTKIGIEFAISSTAFSGVWVLGNHLSSTQPVVNGKQKGINIVGNSGVTDSWMGGLGLVQATSVQGTTPLVTYANAAGTERMAFDSSARLQFVDSALRVSGVATPATVDMFEVVGPGGTIYQLLGRVKP